MYVCKCACSCTLACVYTWSACLSYTFLKVEKPHVRFLSKSGLKACGMCELLLWTFNKQILNKHLLHITAHILFHIISYKCIGQSCTVACMCFCVWCYHSGMHISCHSHPVVPFSLPLTSYKTIPDWILGCQRCRFIIYLSIWSSDLFFCLQAIAKDKNTQQLHPRVLPIKTAAKHYLRFDKTPIGRISSQFSIHASQCQVNALTVTCTIKESWVFSLCTVKFDFFFVVLLTFIPWMRRLIQISQISQTMISLARCS